MPLINMSYEEQLDMINSSRNLITQKLSIEPAVYAYPKGAYDSVSIKCLKKCRFSHGLSLVQGINHSSDDPYHLKRMTIRSKNLMDILKVLKIGFKKPKTIISGDAMVDSKSASVRSGKHHKKAVTGASS